jgi:transcriptional regulator with XRE-family HTH domain
VSAQILLFGFMDDLPNRIRVLRLARDWSQDRLAEAVSCSKMTISDLERGNVGLTLEWMRRIAAALDLTPGELLTPDDNPLLPVGEEREIIERYRDGSPEQRENLARVADALIPPAEEKKRKAKAA